ncbi:MarR family transcriptional regulator [Bradyrhizobium sp. 1]|uniref:MarR family winged helix-turn-helix transcriptional regulator n=1 Tax=Bradyrhizobium sp. 1 TaxID=241591 RepID=UPI001FF7B99F|nr:MarR family transcriptional regulator [Bradyrhizobium sp. 1]MCK1394483.1 MarR family transcriptional regulator [Bradyrhizobium sp. 1]
MTREANEPDDVERKNSCPDEAGELIRSLLGFQLRRAHTLFALHWHLSFSDQKARVTPMQGGMLLVIESQPGLMQTTLAQIMDVEGPTLIEALTKLEEKGLVSRIRRVGDRRSYALHLTSAGRRMVARVKEFVPDREAELLVDLSDDERSLLLDLLRRLVRRAKIVTAELSSPKRAARAPIEHRKARAKEKP